MKIVYLNGFRGGGPSEKIEALKAAFPGDVINEYIPARREEALSAFFRIAKMVDPSEETIFVGTSLGGFWSLLTSSATLSKAVLINPCLDPEISLRKYIGEEVDGRVWTAADCDDFIGYPDNLINDGIQRIVLLETGDEVIPTDRVIELCKMNEEFHPEVRIFSGGNHRFTNYPAIVTAIKDLATQELI